MQSVTTISPKQTSLFTEETLTSLREDSHVKILAMQKAGQVITSISTMDLTENDQDCGLKCSGQLKKLPPPWVVAENVQALTKQGIDIVLQTLSEIGYNAEWCVLPASFFGSPHYRERTWIVAYPHGIGRDEESIVFGKILSQTVRYSPQWEFSRTICKINGKKTLPESFGIHDGIPTGLYRNERIAALGNSVVPFIPFQIFKEIEQFNKLTNEKQQAQHKADCDCPSEQG